MAYVKEYLLREYGRSMESMEKHGRWMFWWLWRLYVGRYYLCVMTPWFAVELSSGNVDIVMDGSIAARCWYGLRVHWGHNPGWRYEPDLVIYRRGDHFLSFQRRLFP